MATPEDLNANAEFISLADFHVAVPGGPNSNNYANVDLIMRTALQNSCDAIYPGWGHASENPILSRECTKLKGKVVFLGPTEEAMFALGDKIASTIVAQSNGVPTVPWSGDEIRLPPGVFEVDPLVYEMAYITSVEECEEVCARIGFPVMIKASEGGGGKGIRRCLRMEDVSDMFVAVSEEVKGCHIFVMRMLENVRHLEVQLLADEYGDCIAVHTRDCSVQRRHQKLIEEGPVFGVDPSIIASMEAAAIRLAKAVGYRGLGTVEYMYDKATDNFFFLELNPRIQVEHPVSELISGVNLPAALLCVGMGVPLHRVPEVRSFYGERPYTKTPINFSQRRSLPAKGHTIAVRVTAENTEEGFCPTTGRVEEITFKNSKECWGYFSANPGGEIHQFADSQF
ncbi:putative mitochondrial acetyl-CoA carboxylase, partial [Trypanosoma cruzi]